MVTGEKWAWLTRYQKVMDMDISPGEVSMVCHLEEGGREREGEGGRGRERKGEGGKEGEGGREKDERMMRVRQRDRKIYQILPIHWYI